MNVEAMVAKYNLKPKGVIQVGSHHGEEVPLWNRMGIKQVHFEPCRANYTKMMTDYPGVEIYPVALGRYSGTDTMYTETINGGQSNSLLRPEGHLRILPWIEFNGKERVVVSKLDYFSPWDGFNFLYIDTQGTELDVLVGGQNTLTSMDFVFTEVNRAEVYQGCSKVEDIDWFLGLYGLSRVETEWHGGDFGDGLYVRA